MIKEKRLEILNRIDALFEEEKTATSKRQKEIQKELRKLGRQLEGLKRPIRLANKYRPLDNFNMTVQDYLQYKEREYSDKEICEAYGCSRTFLWKWKQKNGLIN